MRRLWECEWHDLNDYFIEYQNRDRGHGYIQPTPVINVKVENIKKAEFTSL